jgi:hypothetical protein
MRKSAKSVAAFGIYLLGVGLGFLLLPNLMLSLFGFDTTSEPWIRVVAMLVLILAYYYIQAARHARKEFFRFTVHARALVILFFGAFVALGIAAPMLLLFGLVDLAAALWTASALKSEFAPVLKL